MDTTADIISGTSIGGIMFNSDISDILLDLYEKNINVEIFNFKNNGIVYTFHEIDGGVLSITIDDKSEIQAICCNKPYAGKYKGILSPGMRVDEIIECTSTQLIINGFLIVNRDFGIGFNLPNEYDDVDSANELPPQLLLDEIHILKKGWCGSGWR